jgi:signal transduction histidine kinase
MTRNYLELSRVEKGELDVEPNDIDLVRDAIRPVLAEFEHAALERKVHIEARLPDEAPLRGDAVLLRVVCKNLVDNALKYGREGGTIKLSLDRCDETWRLVVWNEGDGLSPDKLNRLFQKFVRFGREETVARRGTGLGLFITRAIVTKHGGEIRAESEEGRWMQFTVTVPVGERVRPAGPAMPSSPSAPQA